MISREALSHGPLEPDVVGLRLVYGSCHDLSDRLFLGADAHGCLRTFTRLLVNIGVPVSARPVV